MIILSMLFLFVLILLILSFFAIVYAQGTISNQEQYQKWQDRNNEQRREYEQYLKQQEYTQRREEFKKIQEKQKEDRINGKETENHSR